MKQMEYDLEDFKWIPLASFSFAVFISNVGILSVHYCIIVEVLPQKVRVFSLFKGVYFNPVNYIFFYTFADKKLWLFVVSVINVDFWICHKWTVSDYFFKYWYACSDVHFFRNICMWSIFCNTVYPGNQRQEPWGDYGFNGK